MNKGKTLSDERLKNIYGEDIGENILNDFAKIDAIRFTYTPEAQGKYQGELGVDNLEHIGVTAQDLESVPVTESTVTENENGNKIVNSEQLVMTEAAAVSELSRRVLALEQALQELLKRA